MRKSKLCLDIDAEIIADSKINEDLRHFFSEITPQLHHLDIPSLPADFIKTFIRSLRSTFLSNSEFEDYKFFWTQKYSPSISEDVEQQVYSDLKYANEDERKYLDEVVTLFLEKNRYDVLRKIKPFVEDILCKKSTSGISCSDVVPSAKASKSIQLEKSDSISSCIKIVKLPPKSSPEKFELSVFIAHSKIDIDVVKRLVLQLSYSFNYRAIPLYNVEVNDIGNLEKELYEADFVLLLISSTYLKYVNPSNSFEQDSDAQYNRFIFRWIQAEYAKNNSNNFRVIPVLHPDVNVDEVMSLAVGGDLFMFFFRLFEDVPELVETMKDMMRDRPKIENRVNLLGY